MLIYEYGIDRVYIFPWAIDIKGTEKGFKDRKDICFIGSYQHPPNIDAAVYFIKNIFPLIQEKLPGIRFLAIGSKPPKELTDMATEQIIVTGFVEDLNPLLDQVRVAVAPLRYGAGIKGKIGTTLSVGLPCVATTIAAEGMELTEGEEILIADQPQDFADAVVGLYDSRELWERLSENGIKFSDKMYGMESGLEIMRTILDSVGLLSTGSSADIRRVILSQAPTVTE